MAEMDKASFVAAAKARGIVLPAAEVKPALDGANWLRACIALLREGGVK